MVGIILAAGDGNRYKQSIGKNDYKVLSTINGKFLPEFALSNLKALNIKKAFIVVGECGETIKKEIGYNYKGIEICYVVQPERKGLINALIKAITISATDDIILQLADEVFMNFRREEVLQSFSENISDFLCGITYESDSEKIKMNYSVSVDEKMYLTGCREKPDMVTNDIKGTGFCVFNRQCVELLYDAYDEKSNKPYDLCDFMNFLLLSGKQGRCICIAEKEFNINKYSDLLEAEKHLKNNIV